MTDSPVIPAGGSPSSQPLSNHSFASYPWTAFALCFAVIAAYVATPPPSYNESHYVPKASHFWRPDWASSDFFLTSPGAHLTFDIVTGWWSLFLSLEAVTWIGRFSCWGLMAWSWLLLLRALVPAVTQSALMLIAPATLGLFVAWSRDYTMAGEWVVGGFESKAIAWPLVFAGLAALIRGDTSRSFLLVATACALHVLVGGWTLVLVLPMACWQWWRGQLSPPSMLAAVCGAGLIAAGVISTGWATLFADPAATTEAALIQVYERLPHHLLPPFRGGRVARFMLPVAAWLVLLAFTWHRRGLAWLHGAAVGSLILVALGLIWTWAPWLGDATRAKLLRFYWFRSADVYVPLAASAAAGVLLLSAWTERRWVFRIGYAATVCLAVYCLSWRALDVNLSAWQKHYAPSAQAWRDAMAWILANTPRDARFITPHQQPTFQWYSGRGNVADAKHMPQSPAATIEWKHRLARLHPSGEGSAAGLNADRTQFAKVHSAADMKALGREYQAGYLLAPADPPLDLPVLYENAEWVVYDLQRDSD